MTTPVQGCAVLVIEDDPAIGGAIVRGLRRNGFDVELSANGGDAFERVRNPRFSAYVLDLMLPEVDGVDILRRIRRVNSAPVLVVSARDDLPQRLEVFSIGAVDFLPKPFFVEELVARLQLHLGRRMPGPAKRFGRVVASNDATEIRIDGRDIVVSVAERTVLFRLLEAQGQIVSRDALAAALGERKPVCPRTVDSYVARLRSRLGDDGQRIQTVWGRGYRLVADDA